MATISRVPQKRLWGLYKVYKTCISTIMVLRLWKRTHLVTYPLYQLWNLVETKSLTSAMLPSKTLDNLRQLIWVAIICRGFHLELSWVSFTVNQKKLAKSPLLFHTLLYIINHNSALEKWVSWYILWGIKLPLVDGIGMAVWQFLEINKRCGQFYDFFQYISNWHILS